MKVKNHTFKRHLIYFCLLSMISITSINAEDKSTEAILQSFVESYKADNMAHTITFGVLVGDGIPTGILQCQRNLIMVSGKVFRCVEAVSLI